MPEDFVTQIKDWFYIHSLASVRMAALFNTLPMLNKQITGSAMVRNGIVMCLAIFLFPMVKAQEPSTSIRYHDFAGPDYERRS